MSECVYSACHIDHCCSLYSWSVYSVHVCTHTLVYTCSTLYIYTRKCSKASVVHVLCVSIPYIALALWDSVIYTCTCIYLHRNKYVNFNRLSPNCIAAWPKQQCRSTVHVMRYVWSCVSVCVCVCVLVCTIEWWCVYRCRAG